MKDIRIKLALLSLPQRTQAVLEFFISNDGRDKFILSTEDKSDVAVFDFDIPESLQHWQRYQSKVGKPGILLSVTEQKLPKTVWVQKPVTAQSMLDAAGKISAPAALSAPKPVPVFESAPKSKSPAKPLPKAAIEAEPKAPTSPELKLAVLSLPQRTQAVLEFFISNDGRDKFVLSTEDKSDVAIFDFDIPESLQHWQRYQSKVGKPGILLSVTEQKLPKTVWVQKPVTAQSMLDAAGKISAPAAISAPKPVPVFESAPKSKSPAKPLSKAAIEAEPKAPPSPELKLAVLSLPQRTQAVLEFFISNDGRDKFVLSTEDKSDVAVFDFDIPESLQHWQRYQSKVGKPGILLSVTEQRHPNTVWVQKPVTAQSMLDAAGKISASNSSSAPKPLPVAESAPKSKSPAKPLSKSSNEAEPKAPASPELKLAVLSLPQRTQAVLEFFIANDGRDKFILSTEDKSDVAVFDFDIPESLQHWQRYQSKVGKPGILLSVTEQKLPKTVWLQKPVTTQSMLDASAKISSGDWTTTQFVSQDTSPTTTPSSTPTIETEKKFDHENTSIPVTSPSLFSSEDVQPVAVLDESSEITKLEAHPDKRVWHERLASVFTRSSKPHSSETKIIIDEPIPLSNDKSPVTSPAEESLPDQVIEVVQVELPPEKVKIEIVDADSNKIDRKVRDEAIQSQEATAPTIAIKQQDQTPLEPQTKPTPTPIEALDKAELEDAVLYCGVGEDLPGSGIKYANEMFFDYDNYLISALRETYIVGSRWRSPTRLDLDTGWIIFDPIENHAFMNFELSALFDQCITPQSGAHKVRTVGIQEFAEMQLKSESRTKLDSFDTVLWRIALVTAKGKLPKGTNSDKVFYLKHRPDMTHFQSTPFNQRIAELWATRGASLVETARVLNIPQRYVFAYYNAVLAIDLVTDDGKLRQENSGSGVLSKIFKRLLT